MVYLPDGSRLTVDDGWISVWLDGFILYRMEATDLITQIGWPATAALIVGDYRYRHQRRQEWVERGRLRRRKGDEQDGEQR